MLRRCFAVYLRKSFIDDETSADFPSEWVSVDDFKRLDELILLLYVLLEQVRKLTDRKPFM